jgi:hypothetical protein
LNNYYEELHEEPEFPCDNCRWVVIVSGNEAPCKYCENHGCQEEPEDFDYKKLKEEKFYGRNRI